MMKYRGALVLGAAVLVLSACSSDSAVEAPEAPSSPAEGDEGLAVDGPDTPEVVVDEAIRQRLDVAPGSAVIPGSIESVRVEDLSSGCAEGVSAMRELIDSFDSVRQVPPDGTFEAARAAGQSACTAQEWSDFYTKELAGWIYAAARD